MKIGACYIRVSTADQTEYSPDSQLRMIRDYAAKNDIILSEEYIYRDEGISGRSAEKRPAFQEMISAAKQKNFETILIYSTSRFARNHEQSIVYRSMLERDCGVEVISITQPNVDKKTDMLTGAIYSIMDEWYSLDLSDNVRRGMTQKAMQGGYQTSPPLGYEQKYKGALMTIKEDEAEIIRYIFEQYLNNISKWAIARNLNERGIKSKRGYSISTRSIYYILRNPVYKGYARWTPTKRVYWDFKNEDTITAKGKHEAIISEEFFDMVQEKIDAEEVITKKKPRPQESMKHWLSGLIKCSACGRSLVFNDITPRRKKPIFRCGGYGKGVCKIINFITAKEAEKNVIEYFLSVSKNMDILRNVDINILENNSDQINHLKSEIKKNINKLERAKQGFLNGFFEAEEYRNIKNTCDKAIIDAKVKIEALNHKTIDYLPLQKEIRNIANVLESDDYDKREKQIAIRSIVEKIVFDKKNRVFRFYFYR